MCVIFLMGPTAIGKTELACQLYEHLPIKLISVDSALIYKGMDIGTGKPSASELARYPHALIDICDPSEPFSVGDFLGWATQEIKNALSQQRIPLLVGGTMMYFKALKEGLANLPKTTAEIRTHVQQLLQDKGLDALYRRLEKVDSATANRLNAHDTQRILRALEIYEQTGTPMSVFLTSPHLHWPPLPYPILALALIPHSRDWLHSRIEKRFLNMLEKGLIEETQGLLQAKSSSVKALRSVGYRQVLEYLLGEADYDTMVRKAVAATRQLAKRQLTWIRSWPGAVKVEVPADSLLLQIQDLIQAFCRSSNYKSMIDFGDRGSEPIFKI